jgi:hypothetical protein
MPFILGARGNEWAWQQKRWESIEAFQATQRRWRNAGIIVVSVAVGLSVVAVVASISLSTRLTTTSAPIAQATIPPEAEAFSNKLTSDDGSVSVRLPDDWRENKSVLEQVDTPVEIGASAPSEEEFLILAASPRSDVPASLASISENRARKIASLNENGTFSEALGLQINGNDAIQREVRTTIEDVDLVYLLTIIEGDERLVEVLLWTTPSNWSQAGDRFRAIAGTIEAT